MSFHETTATQGSRTRSLPPVQVVDDDYERLSDVVCASPRETEALALLWSELLRAEIISPAEAPQDLVRLNSVVRYTDLRTLEQDTVRLVYPGPDALAAGEIRATSALGASLIGLRPGATFFWTSAKSGLRVIRVDAVSQDAPRARRKAGRAKPARAPCAVDETLEQSFPASDAPSWTLGLRRS